MNSRDSSNVSLLTKPTLSEHAISLVRCSVVNAAFEEAKAAMKIAGLDTEDILQPHFAAKQLVKSWSHKRMSQGGSPEQILPLLFHAGHRSLHASPSYRFAGCWRSVNQLPTAAPLTSATQIKVFHHPTIRTGYGHGTGLKSVRTTSLSGSSNQTLAPATIVDHTGGCIPVLKSRLNQRPTLNFSFKTSG